MSLSFAQKVVMAESQPLLIELGEQLDRRFRTETRWNNVKQSGSWPLRSFADRMGCDFECPLPGMLRCRFGLRRDPTITVGREFDRVFVDRLLRWYLHIPDGSLMSDRRAYLLCLDKVRAAIANPQKLRTFRAAPGNGSQSPFVVLDQWRRFVDTEFDL